MLNGGLVGIDLEADTFRQYLHDPEDPRSLGDDILLDVHQDQNGVLWAATVSGLDRLDFESGTFQHYREKDGLANNTIYGKMDWPTIPSMGFLRTTKKTYGSAQTMDYPSSTSRMSHLPISM
jgi:hypothetical protein